MPRQNRTRVVVWALGVVSGLVILSFVGYHVRLLAGAKVDRNQNQDRPIASSAATVFRCTFGPALSPSSPIDAFVKAVSSRESLVLLSTGKDQGVQSGYQFTIYRGGEFIGKVKVIKVYPDLAGAEILFVKEGAEVRAGDRATTSF